MRPKSRSRLAGLLLPVIVVLAAACGGRSPVDPLRTEIVPALGGHPATTRQDHADIVNAEIHGDTLRLVASFGGGCARHDFALLRDRVFIETLPVQVHVQLTHNANGDPCRALLSQALAFDLSPLKQAYLTAYGSRGTILIHLHAPGGGQSPERPLRYEF